MSGKSIAHAVLQTCNCVTKRLAILRLQSFMISYAIQSWHQSYKITGTRTTKETAQQNHKQQKPPTKKMPQNTGLCPQVLTGKHYKPNHPSGPIKVRRWNVLQLFISEIASSTSSAAKWSMILRVIQQIPRSSVCNCCNCRFDAWIGMSFFFLHCRASTRHSRSTTGNSQWSETLIGCRIFTRKNQATQTHNKTQNNPTPQRPVKIRKIKVKLIAALSAPHSISSTM